MSVLPRRPRLWAVQAQVVTETFDGTVSRQVPTFYLDPVVQGITGQEGAVTVASDILMTMAGDSPEVNLHVSVEPVY